MRNWLVSGNLSMSSQWYIMLSAPISQFPPVTTFSPAKLLTVRQVSSWPRNDSISPSARRPKNCSLVCFGAWHVVHLISEVVELNNIFIVTCWCGANTRIQDCLQNATQKLIIAVICVFLKVCMYNVTGSTRYISFFR